MPKEKEKDNADIIKTLFAFRRLYGADVKAVLLVQKGAVHILTTSTTREFYADVEDEGEPEIIPFKQGGDKDRLEADYKPPYFG